MKDLISPVVERIVTNPGSFPDVNHQLIVLRGNKDADTCLRELFYSKIYDKNQYDRVSLLINTWGSAPFEKNLVNGQELFAGIPSQFFEQVNLQFPNGEAKEISKKERELLIHKLDVNSAEKTVQSNDRIEQKYQEIPLDRLNEYDEFIQVLEKWKNGDKISTPKLRTNSKRDLWSYSLSGAGNEDSQYNGWVLFRKSRYFKKS